eukprot:292183-Hanusia_phi.AAC.1
MVVVGGGGRRRRKEGRRRRDGCGRRRRKEEEEEELVIESQASVQDRTGALYFVITTQIFSAQVNHLLLLSPPRFLLSLMVRHPCASFWRSETFSSARDSQGHTGPPLLLSSSLLLLHSPSHLPSSFVLSLLLLSSSPPPFSDGLQDFLILLVPQLRFLPSSRLYSLLGYFLVGLQTSLPHVLTFCLSVIITTLAAE